MRKHSALQICGVTYCSSGHVYARPGLRKRGQRRRHHDRCHILYENRGRVHSDAHTLPENVRQGLRGENGLAFIARTIQTDDQAVAHRPSWLSRTPSSDAEFL